jgi:hypothetical protein
MAGINFLSVTQSTPSTAWAIQHNMGSMPSVDTNVYDSYGVLQKAFPLSVTQIDANNILITWSTPFAGFATLTTV